HHSLTAYQDTTLVPTATISFKLQWVIFSFPDEWRPTLQHIPLDLPAGSKTAIVGPSGSGKSALFHLLLKIYAADSGSMNIAGKSSDTIKDEDLWKRSRAVLQENHFFNGTIRSNLQLAGDDLTHADMSTALR